MEYEYIMNLIPKQHQNYEKVIIYHFCLFNYTKYECSGQFFSLWKMADSTYR